MEAQDPLEKFGKFLVENLRDRGINYAHGLLNNHWKTPAILEIQTILSNLDAQQKKAVQAAFIKTIDTAIHDFLFALQEEAEADNEIQIFADGNNIAELSDGLEGESYLEDGWNAKFSKYL